MAAKAYLACSLKFYFERVTYIRISTPAAPHFARWRGDDDSPEAIVNAYELAFLRLERDEGPVNFNDAAEREKDRQDGLRVVAASPDSPTCHSARRRVPSVDSSENE